MQPTTTSRTYASRWGAAAGIGFAALLLYALLGPPSAPDQKASNTAWEAFMADGSNRNWIIAEAGAATIAGMLFVVFLAGLRRRGAMPPANGLSVLGYGCGLLFAMSVLATFALWVSVPAGIQIGGEPLPSADVIRLSGDLGRAFIGLPVPLCAGLFALAVGLDARTTRGIPQWLAIAGIVIGIMEIVGGIFFLPLLLFPVWIAAVSVTLLRRPSVAGQDVAPAVESAVR